MAKGIYKRGEVYWIRYAGLDGKVIRESSHSDKFREAEGLLIDRKQTIKAGKQPLVKKKIPHVSFKGLSEEYLQWAKRQRGFAQKEILIKQLVGIFGNYPLRAFDTRLLEQYQTERLETKRNKPATINRHLATIKHMINKAVEWDLVEEEVLKRVRRVKLLEENNRRLRYLTKEECRKLIDASKGHIRHIVVTALNTGMRRSEILSLKWENIDLAHGFILLNRTKNGERREIPINATLRETLEALPRRIDGGHVFFDPSTGLPFGDIKNGFNGACRRAGIKDFVFHDLRHTFASHLVMAGVDITTIKELLGHKTLTMTMRYAHLAPSHKVRAVDILNETLNEMNCTKTAQFGG